MFLRDGRAAVVLEATPEQVLVELDGGKAAVLHEADLIPAESAAHAREREGNGKQQVAQS